MEEAANQSISFHSIDWKERREKTTQQSIQFIAGPKSCRNEWMIDGRAYRAGLASLGRRSFPSLHCRVCFLLFHFIAEKKDKPLTFRFVNSLTINPFCSIWLLPWPLVFSLGWLPAAGLRPITNQKKSSLAKKSNKYRSSALHASLNWIAHFISFVFVFSFLRSIMALLRP